MIKQRDAVFEAVTAVVGELDGSPVSLTKDQRKSVIDAVTANIVSGNVDFSTTAAQKYDSSEKIRTYVSGLVTNWLKKDSRLNGGEKYTPANPGTGTPNLKDEQLKAMKLLRKTFVESGETDKVEQVDIAIKQRLEDLKVAKTSKTPAKPKEEIDMSLVPDELKAMLGIAS